MAREQLGICAEANLHGSYLLLNALEGQEAVLRQKLACLPVLFNRLAEHFSESMLTGVIAVGSNYWDSLYPAQRPAGLAPFPALEFDGQSLATVPADLFIQIRSDRLDVNYITLQQVFQLLRPNVELLEQMQCFRYLDGRDLTGFIDSGYNARGGAKRKIALVSAQPLFAGGSFVHVQRFYYDLPHWQQLPVTQQENIMGINKVDGKWLPQERLSDNSHVLMMHCGQPEQRPAVLLQNMPFGQLSRQGLLSVSYAAQGDAFGRILHYRLGLTEETSGYDLLLDYMQPDWGAAFFAPSVSFLEMAAQADLNSP
ncbi:Dyp-type peroxidase [Chromatiaceae bacterium AAb-1]|nr:Dyp-type peroxidase [Chromatiaceae bacterium AAb-1]